jgi:hypothetical protein
VAARITLKAVNEELARRGIQTVLAKGSGYFYFRTGEAADWLEKTVRVPTINALTLEQWMDEFKRLKKVNQDIMGAGKKTAENPQSRAPRRAPTTD